MSFKSTVDQGEAPLGPHLGLLLGDGKIQAIPPGATLYIIEDPSSPGKIFPFILKSCRHDKITFVSEDLSGARVEYVFKCVSQKPLNAAALQRIAKARGTTA